MHPTPYPILLPLRCIYSVLYDTQGGIVIDPYVGSGSTAIAAKLLGQYFIGIDTSEEYIELAQKRLENLRQYADIVNEEKNRHIVRKTFKERKKNGDFTGKFAGAGLDFAGETPFLGTLF